MTTAEILMDNGFKQYNCLTKDGLVYNFANLKHKCYLVVNVRSGWYRLNDGHREKGWQTKTDAGSIKKFLARNGFSELAKIFRGG